MNKTKIICTIGPATESREKLLELINKGMDVARINMSYAGHDQARDIIYTIRELNKELNKSVGILIDTKGPELCLNTFEGKEVKISQGDTVILTSSDGRMVEDKFYINHSGLIDDVKKGDKVLLEDGLIELVVTDEIYDDVICEVVTGGTIRNNMGINIPGVKLNIDFLSETDKEDIAFASAIDADYIGLSFVSSANDVLDVNDVLIQLRNEHMQIISKIENKCAVEDLDNIIKVSDGVMIARGDLGLEISLEEIPYLQKKVVDTALTAKKICIVATQMLGSMVYHHKPTRAEVSDVANAVIEGVDAVTLSEETAVGRYPIETVATMERIISNMESNIEYDRYTICKTDDSQEDITTIIANSVASSADKLKASAVVASSISGYTAKVISSFRPRCPIIVTTPNEQTARGLSLNFGTIPVITPMFSSTDEIVDKGLAIARQLLSIEEGIVIITGSFPSQKNNTNFMKIEQIKENG